MSAAALFQKMQYSSAFNRCIISCFNIVLVQLSMVTGQTGADGQNVPRVVVEDSKQEVGRALTRVQRMEVVIAREAKLRQPHVTRHHVRVSMSWSGIGPLRVVSLFFLVRQAKRAGHENDHAPPLFVASRGFALARVNSPH